MLPAPLLVYFSTYILFSGKRKQVHMTVSKMNSLSLHRLPLEK